MEIAQQAPEQKLLALRERLPALERLSEAERIALSDTLTRMQAVADAWLVRLRRIRAAERRRFHAKWRIHRDRTGILAYLREKDLDHRDGRRSVTVAVSSVRQRRTMDWAGDPAHATSDIRVELAVGQTVVWDFHERRVRVSLYRLHGRGIWQWSLEGSSDGRNWTDLDQAPPCAGRGAYPACGGVVCRYLRLTQRELDNWIPERASTTLLVEFFGILLE
jgi:hypothetical protein